MRVMIVGQKWLATELLRMCLARGDDVAAVSVQRLDDRLAALAMAEDAPVCQVQRRLTAEWVPHDVDVILCAHAHVFISAEARAKARFGALGFHPSLLPRHRGRDATRWAIHMGEHMTGGTAYWLDDGADTGPIAAQDWCWIRPGDTPETLWRRDLAPMGLRLFGEVLQKLERGENPRTPQDAGLATWEPSFTSGTLGGDSLPNA